mgnify:CR=1 FL=1
MEGMLPEQRHDAVLGRDELMPHYFADVVGIAKHQVDLCTIIYCHKYYSGMIVRRKGNPLSRASLVALATFDVAMSKL